MKTLFSLLMVSMMSFAAQARTAYGSECGLIDFADDFQLSPVKTQTLSEKSKLSSLQQQQVLNMAPEMKTMSIHEALAYLVEGSESGDVYYEAGSFQGKQYQVIRYYPGGNPYGTIYLKGSTEPLAYIQDSDLVCAQK